MKKLLLLLLFCAPAAAQNTQITASHISSFGGAVITGTFCLSPTNLAGQPINLTTSTGQQFSPRTPLCFPINAGALPSYAIVPDTSLTQPANPCYALTVIDTYGRQVGSYACLQPQGSTWSFDAYVPSSLPSIPALTLPQFQTNGTANPAQGYLDIDCTGCTSSGGHVTIPSSSLPSIATNTVLGNVSGSTGTPSALTASQLSTLLGLGSAALQSASAFDAAGSAAAILVSPAFTGNPTAPTQTAGNNSTRLATTAFVQAAIPAASVASVFGRTGAVTAASGDYSVSQVTGAAPLASPALTGTPTAPTQTAGDNTTKIATDAFVQAAIPSVPVASVFGRTGAVTAASGDYSVSQVTGAAPLASPALTGNPTAPTQTAGDNTTKIATDAFVQAAIPSVPVASVFGRTGAVTAASGDYSVSQVTGAAPLASPALTGTPTTPTQSTGDTSTDIADDAFVANTVALSNLNLNGGTATGSVNALAITLASSLGSPTLAQLTNIMLCFLPNLANTSGAPTLQVNSTAATTIVKYLAGNSASLTAGDIAVNNPACVIYNGTSYVLQNPQVYIIGNSTGELGATGIRGGSLTASATYQSGTDGASGSNIGTATFRGGNNTNTGASGAAILEPGAQSGGGTQGTASMQQSFTVASALGNTFEVVSMTTTSDRVQAAAVGSTSGNVGVAQTVGGSGTQLYVAADGKTTVRFDGTPVVGDIACFPPASTGTAGLAHDNGTTACAAGQKLGIVTGQVSGTGSGATATVLLQIGS